MVYLVWSGPRKEPDLECCHVVRKYVSSLSARFLLCFLFTLMHFTASVVTDNGWCVTSIFWFLFRTTFLASSLSWNFSSWLHYSWDKFGLSLYKAKERLFQGKCWERHELNRNLCCHYNFCHCRRIIKRRSRHRWCACEWQWRALQPHNLFVIKELVFQLPKDTKIKCEQNNFRHLRAVWIFVLKFIIDHILGSSKVKDKLEILKQFCMGQEDRGALTLKQRQSINTHHWRATHYSKKVELKEPVITSLERGTNVILPGINHLIL